MICLVRSPARRGSNLGRDGQSCCLQSRGALLWHPTLPTGRGTPGAGPELQCKVRAETKITQANPQCLIHMNNILLSALTCRAPPDRHDICSTPVFLTPIRMQHSCWSMNTAGPAKGLAAQVPKAAVAHAAVCRHSIQAAPGAQVPCRAPPPLPVCQIWARRVQFHTQVCCRFVGVALLAA